MTRLTKERIAELYERPRQSTDIDMLYSALNEILAHIAATLPPEAEAPKPERCGGAPGKPRLRYSNSGGSDYLGWHSELSSCYQDPACVPCPGCPDCAPKADWTLEAAREWLHYPEGNIVAKELAAIIRKHAPKGV